MYQESATATREPDRHRVIQLPSGRRLVALRPARPGDIPGIAALFAGLSADSFGLRFGSPPRSTKALLRLARTDRHPGTVCVVAERLSPSGTVIAEARAEPLADGSAELGIAVADAYQSGGLGRLLLDAVLEQARLRGLPRVQAAVSPANTAMLRLVAPGGWAIREPGGGDVLHLEAAPDRRMPAFPPRDGRRRVLVEGGGWSHDGMHEGMHERIGSPERNPRAGDVVRRCPGPSAVAGGSCPLLTSGRCRLAEGADIIVSRLPRALDAIVAVHRQRWPERLR